jgi:hypothetical protein
MMHAHSRGKEQNKGIKGGSYAERKAFWQRRHALLEEWVDRYEVIDRELACARLGWARTSSNLNLAGLLLHRLTKRGWFNEWRQEDVVYYVTLKIHLRSKDEQKQLMHRHMGARRAALFEMNWQQDFYTYLNEGCAQRRSGLT